MSGGRTVGNNGHDGLSAQWKSFIDKEGANIRTSLNKQQVEGKRAELTSAIIDFYKMSKQQKGPAFEEALRVSLGMSLKEYRTKMDAAIKDMSSGKVSAEDLATKALGILECVGSVPASDVDTSARGSYVEAVRIMNKIDGLRNEFKSASAERTKDINDVLHKLEEFESKTKKLNKLQYEFTQLRRDDTTDISLGVANDEARLEFIEKRRAGIAQHLMKAESAVDRVLLPIKGIANKHDHGISGRRTRLSDYLENFSRILDDYPGFSEAVEELRIRLVSGRLSTKTEKIRERLIIACDTAMERDAFETAVKAAKGLSERLVSVDGQIEDLKARIKMNANRIRTINDTVSAYQGSIGMLRTEIDYAKSQIEGALRKHGIDAEVSSNSVDIRDWPKYEYPKGTGNQELVLLSKINLYVDNM